MFVLNFFSKRDFLMKIFRFLGFLLVMIPCVCFAATGNDFQNASQLLTAARRGDVQTVQMLINSGVDVNYTDSTGMSLVCTAVMNNDKRAIQVLQMYGADASKCDRQIKQYKQRSRVARAGNDYGFFSGLSSTHNLVLGALGVAAVIGGVALLTDAFDSDSNRGSSGSNGNRPNNNGSGEGSSAIKLGFTVPYGPAYLNPTTGAVDVNTDIDANLATWDATPGNLAIRIADFNYFRPSVATEGNYEADGLVSTLQNYLLVMHGYNSFANGYMGQNTFRNETSHVPELSQTGYQRQPVRVGLITGSGINPAGSADLGDGIVYASSTALNADTTRVDKYINNTLSGNSGVYVRTEQLGFDLSGSGSVFNPFADVNESALAKIVAGWEAGGRSKPDLYGFVPNGQLAIYRTGNGNIWQNAAGNTVVGTLAGGDNVLSVDDTVTLDSKEYNIVRALYPDGGEGEELPASTVTVGTTQYQLSSGSKMFLAKCVEASGCTSDIAIYVGTDGYWYVNSTGGNDVDAVYAVNSVGDIIVQKEKVSSAYTNFQALNLAVSYNKNTSEALNVIAMANVLDNSRNAYYLTVKDFAVAVQDLSEISGAYQNMINYYYDYNNYGTANSGQGGQANSAFSGMPLSSTVAPMIIMPAGDYLARTSVGTKYAPLDAVFENYAPLAYSGTLNHNFMTIVAVNNSSSLAPMENASTIADYGNGIAYGKLMLSQWADSSGNAYVSRKCGLTGVGNSSVDPWCFAASGPNAEMATAAAAGAVASVKSAFPYMTNNQVFTLLALTAEGPFLKTTTNGTTLTSDALAKYLDEMYTLPNGQSFENMTTSEYLSAFQDVYGYGLINLERALKPGYSVYYYSEGNIVSSSGNNQFWGNVATTSSSRASTVLSLTNRGAITTSFYDVVSSNDDSISLPRVWNMTLAGNENSKHGLYMGDVLGDFNVDSTNKHTRQIGNVKIDMAMSARAYNDNLSGLSDLRVALGSEKYDVTGEYQRFLVDGESRFSGRANGLLSLVANSVTSSAKYKYGNFAFGGRAFTGTITDETLLATDPTVSSQFEPMRLGLANGATMDAGFKNDKFAFNVAVGNLHENNTVLGMYSDGLLTMRGGDTQYVDIVTEYKPFDNVKLLARGTFANTHVGSIGGMISNVSDIKSNAFAIGANVGGFELTAALPLATVDGQMGYDYAEFNVVENESGYVVAINNPHVEYVDLATQNREFRLSGSFKKSVGAWTDAGLGFIYRVNPNNTNEFGNESVFMFKLHHRLGI